MQKGWTIIRLIKNSVLRFVELEISGKIRMDDESHRIFDQHGIVTLAAKAARSLRGGFATSSVTGNELYSKVRIALTVKLLFIYV